MSEQTRSTRTGNLPMHGPMSYARTLPSIRLLVVVTALAAALLGLSASAARAEQQVQSWDLPSKFVSPTDAVFNLTPALAATSGPTGLRTWVVLPDGYTAGRCWPVLYLLHGSGTPTEWLASVDLMKQMQAIVVIPGGGDGQFTNWHNGGKRTPAWERWFFEELVPTVQSRVSVCPDRASHAIAGTSMGGFGALFLASQKPGYFGNAGSFSGMLNIARPEVQIGFNFYKQIWGPPNGFYASGHNPTELVANLRSTRVFTSVGNLTPYDASDVDFGQARLVELVAIAQTKDFVAAARKAKVAVRYEQHQGIHTVPSFRESFTRMLAWNPFGAVKAPAAWKYSTVAQRGDAWGYQYKFSAPPTVVQTLSLSASGLVARGAGRVTITGPDGERIKGALPFKYAKGKVTKLAGAVKPGSGKAHTLPVNVTMTPRKPKLGQTINVRFRTDRKLKPTETYQVLARQQTSDCGVSSAVRVYAPQKGRVVKVKVKPGIGAGHPADQWCLSTGKVELIIVPKKSTGVVLGTFIGEVAFKTVA
jgi:S-formylglutathione hydrolase FrmB